MGQPCTDHTADVCTQYGEQHQAVATQFQSVGGRAHFHGPARTPKCFEGNSMIRTMIATPGDGAVLVVDGGGSRNGELMGGTMGMTASDNGRPAWSSTGPTATAANWPPSRSG
ncbi:RraA family protein [Kocuria kalidii]|uniref:RraA family protein n=1 Tax=Kocuria kalidii TaxID=3376283 RepID=UPI00378AC402